MFGALGAAVLAPGMMIGALVVLAVAGGFASVGALSQAFSGPQVPAAQEYSPKFLSGLTFPRSVAPSTAAAANPAAGGAATAPGGVAGAGAPSGGGSSGGGSGGGRGTGGGGTGGGSGGVGRGPTSASPGSGGSGPGSNPTVVNQVTGTGTAVSGQLPAPLGPLVNQQLGSAAGALNQVLPAGGRVSGTLRPAGS
jgi:hypothetical protein